jgi:PleD family two-component response regulator
VAERWFSKNFTVYVRNFPDGDASSVARLSIKSSWRIDSNKEADHPRRVNSIRKGNNMTGKICIVDHDLSSRGYLRECLEKEGHHVITLDSGYQIRSHLPYEQIDILIMNIDSPGIREKGLLLGIQKPCRPRILLIISERDDPFLKEAIHAGVYGFIHKPFNLGEVSMMVDHLTRSSI